MSMTLRTLAIDASRANRAARTGVEWYAFHVIQELKRIVPDDVRVTLYSEEPLRDGLETLPSNWESAVLSWPPRRLWTQIRLSWETLMHPKDAFFVPAHVPPVLSRGSLVTTLHDVAFMTMPEAYRTPGRWYLRFMYRLAARRGRVLTVSEFSKQEIVKAFSKDADAARITVTPLAPDARFRPTTSDAVSAAMKRNGLTKPYFLFVGRLERKKNFSGLLKAFGAYVRMRPEDDVELVLVGKPGFGYAEEKAAAVAAGVPMARVRELGYADNDDMAALYTGARALVYPSHYEGFGIPILEAMACGTPVIASTATAIPEVAGDAALYVRETDSREVASGMKLVSDDALLAASLREKGIARAAEFSWRRTAEETWVVLEDAMSRPKT